MKKVVLAALLTVLSAGCAVKTDSGLHIFLQRGIVLNLVQTCTHEALVFSPGTKPTKIIGPTPKTMVFDPPVLGDRFIHVTVQTIGKDGGILDTYVAAFAISQQATSTVSWVIGPAQVGGGRVLQTHCSK